MSNRNYARRLARRYLPQPVRRAMLGRRRGPAVERERVAGQVPAPQPPPEPLMRSLERGRPLDRAILAQVRSLVAGKDHHRAESIAASLLRAAETETLGRVAGGIVAYRRGFVELAWERLHTLPRDVWTKFAAAEYVRSGLAVEREQTLDEIRRLAADDPPDVQAKAWFDVMAPVFGLGEGELARRLFAIFDRHVEEDARPWRNGAMHRDWMRPWVAADPDAAGAPAPTGGRRTFAILDYGHPGRKRGSANIGDHIQSIAAMGHLVRHQGLRLHGDEDLVALLSELGSRTRPERRRSDLANDLEVRTIHRDASMYQTVAEDTWVLCFGWFMHALFSIRHGFPLHRNLRPIFISFHCNKRDLLTPEAIEYLRRYGPVGCRDWTTVYLLLSIGVPAFFSGCLTTTIDTVFGEPAEGPPASAAVAYVDMPADEVPAEGVAYAHSSDKVRVRPFTTNVREALQRLDTYRRIHRAVVTSRLHCYLPLRSIGVDTEFRPKNRSDIRFDGLLGLGDEAFDAMRDDLLAKLETVFEAILTGRPEDEVYGLWREITATDVASAEQRRAEHARVVPTAEPVTADVAQAINETVTRGPAAPDGAVHCALVASPDGERAAAVLIASLLEHTRRPLHVWLLGASAEAAERLSGRFPGVGFGAVPAGAVRPDMLPLLLPLLLPTVARVVLLPLPSVATADVAELAALDLGGHALAAPTRPGTHDVSGFGVIHAAAARLQDRTEAAVALRRTAYAHHRFDFDAFSTDVLVLDLEHLRREDLAGRALALIAEYGLTGVEALHFLLGPDRATVPERWACVPTRMPERGPGLLHWADPVMPWQPELTPERDRWRAYDDA